MRSYLFVILSALLLAGLFAAYWVSQPGTPVVVGATGHVARVPRPTTAPGYRDIHPGDRPWLQEFNSEQQLTSEFSGKKFTPRPDGTVDVDEPIATFYLAHQHLEVHGDTANIVVKDVPDMTHTGFSSGGPIAPPNRGRLNHVILHLIDEKNPNDPILTMKTNNVVFDNETYRISTEGYRDAETGSLLADDQVPVHITGQYEMEGRGLVVRWNDKDGRLDLLEIAHGDVLIIRHPGKYSPAAGTRRTTPAVSAWYAAPLPAMLADAGRESAAGAIKSAPPAQPRPRKSNGQPSTHSPSPPIVYLARFFDNVQITQADPSGTIEQISINADRMDVNFLMKSTPGSATQPSAASQPSASQPAGGEPPAGGELPATGPSTTADGAATQPVEPAEQPVYVHWTGMLRITPATATPPTPLSPGNADIVLVGRPVMVHRIEPRQQGTEEIRCASVLYETQGQVVRLEKSADQPHILITKLPGLAAADQRPTLVDSVGSVQYSKSGEQVLLSGPGKAEVPLQSQKGDEYAVLNSEWKQKAQFDFTESAGDRQTTVRQGRFEGDVDIRHPKMELKGQSLDLFFDPPAPAPPPDAEPGPPIKRSGQPNLRQAIAMTGVWCQMQDSQSRKQTIECNRLLLDTAIADDGKLFPRHVNAAGAVHAFGQDDLRAEYVDLLLLPADRAPSGPRQQPGQAPPEGSDQEAQVKLDSMLAKEHVIVHSNEGSVITGDELSVSNQSGKQHTVLTSTQVARVVDARGTTLTGRRIEFDPDDGRARVVGKGTLHAVQQGSTTRPAPDTDVKWDTGAELDGPANRVDVHGGVSAVQVDRKGFVNVATGDQMHIDLRHKPQPPTTRPARAATTQPTTRRTVGGDVVRADPFKDKEVVAITMMDGAKLTSTQKDAQGGIAQQFELAGPTIVVRELGPDGAPSRSVTVPKPGTLLVRDHRPAAKQQQGAARGDGGGARGATAIRYDRLVYSDNARRADFFGKVLVVHQDEDPKSPPARINADHVIALFEPAPKAAPKAKAADADSGQQLKYLTAEGKSVVVTREAARMTARRVDYDPKRHLLIATGTDRNPVIFDDGVTRQVTADGVEWDTITWNTKFTNAVFEVRPTGPVDPHAPRQKQKPLVPLDPRLDHR